MKSFNKKLFSFSLNSCNVLLNLSKGSSFCEFLVVRVETPERLIN